MTRPTRRLLAALGLLVAFMFATTSPAAAHSELVSSSPADGATLEEPPAEVTLTFNENITMTGLQVVAQGPSGTVALGTPIVNGSTVTTAWPQTEPAGDYQVSYRVVSADGHPIDGTIAFTFGGSEPASDAAPAPVPSERSTPPVAAVEAAKPTAAEAEQTGGFPLWVPVVVVIVGVAIGAAIAKMMRRRTAPVTSSSGSQPSDRA